MVFRDQLLRRRVVFADLAHRDVHSLTFPTLFSNLYSLIVEADVYEEI